MPTLIDMRSSTAIAERLGEARFLDFLNRFIFDVSLAIAAAGGEIYKYVGDEVSPPGRWRRGRTKPTASAPVSPRSNASPRARSDYEAEFGLSRRFPRRCYTAARWSSANSAILKKEIALIGDAMNTAARILAACRETGAAPCSPRRRCWSASPGCRPALRRARSARRPCAARNVRRALCPGNKWGAAPATY